MQQSAEAADRYYREVRVPFKDRAIAAAGTTTEADTIFQSFIKAGRGDKAQKFYDALDKKGQAAVQYQLVTKAILDATDPVKGFDSGRFVRSMDKMKDSAGVFFQGSDKMALDGLRNFALHAAKVDQLPLGQGALAAGSAAYGLSQMGLPGAAGVTAGVGGALGLAKALLQFEGGRKFLYAASSLKPGTGAMTDLMKRAVTNPSYQAYLRTHRQTSDQSQRQ